jgi:glycosyltransferase involved in cell wall biosynthesis
MARALRWASRWAASGIAVSQAVRQDADTVLPRLPVAVVANATDTEHYCPGPAAGRFLDDLAGLPPGPQNALRIGLVATYARWKGHDVFLEAAARLVHEGLPQPVRFYIVGGPIYQTQGSQWSLEELRSRAVGLSTADQLGFVPFQADPAPIYRALDVVVHASTLPEPFGLTIIEAMACGRAVIVSRAGGAAELFRDRHDALGITPGDVAGLTAAMRELLTDGEQRRRLGENARITAVERFHRDRLGGEVLAVYNSLQSATS